MCTLQTQKDVVQLCSNIISQESVVFPTSETELQYERASNVSTKPDLSILAVYVAHISFRDSEYPLRQVLRWRRLLRCSAVSL